MYEAAITSFFGIILLVVLLACLALLETNSNSRANNGGVPVRFHCAQTLTSTCDR